MQKGGQHTKANIKSDEKKLKDSDIRVIPIEEDVWEVEVLIPFKDSHDDSLPKILHAKQKFR